MREPRVLGLEAAGELDVAAVPDLVLGDGPRPAADEHVGGLPLDAERSLHVAAYDVEEFGVVECDDARIGTSAGERCERDVPLRCAAGEDRGGEEAAEDAQRLASRCEEPEPVERVGDRRARIAERDDGDGGVRHLCEGATLLPRDLREQ